MNPIMIIELANLLFSSSPDFTKVKSLENEEEKNKIIIEYAKKQIQYCEPTADDCFKKIQEIQKLGNKASCSRLKEFEKLCLDKNYYPMEDEENMKKYVYGRHCSYYSYKLPTSCWQIEDFRKSQQRKMMDEYLKNNQ